MKLYECVAEYRAQLDALAELTLDATTYADTLESMDGDLKDKLRAVIAYSLDLEIEATGAAAASKRMKERAKASTTASSGCGNMLCARWKRLAWERSAPTNGPRRWRRSRLAS